MKLHLGYILGLFAIALAASAGYISVVGWGKLFAGESTIVMVVMGIIEAAKVITTIYLHRYGKRKPRAEGVSRFKYFYSGLLSLKTYLVVGVISTMFLTSVGIYGFLTGAYQDTANKMELHDGEITILEGKKDIFQVKIEDNKSVIQTKTDRITTLSDLRLQQESRLDSLLANNHWSNAKKTQIQIEEANTEIQKLTSDIDVIVINNSSLQDSVSSYQVQILELKGGSDIAAEIGPLKYISSLTGRPMDSIINWLVLVIIFIFDPMAISLVLASNKVFDENKRKGDTPEPTDPEPTEPNDDITFEDVDDEPIEVASPNMDSVVVEDILVYENEDIIEPEPSGTTNEIINEEDLIDGVSESTDLLDVAKKLEGKELFPDKKARAIDMLSDIELPSVDELSLPEEQIEENKEKIKEAANIIDQIKNNTTKTTPVIPTGNVKREEIKEIKEGSRGYSVDVPEPKKVGTNKEVREGEPNKFYFRRPNG